MISKQSAHGGLSCVSKIPLWNSECENRIDKFQSIGSKQIIHACGYWAPACVCPWSRRCAPREQTLSLHDMDLLGETWHEFTAFSCLLCHFRAHPTLTFSVSNGWWLHVEDAAVNAKLHYTYIWHKPGKTVWIFTQLWHVMFVFMFQAFDWVGHTGL